MKRRENRSKNVKNTGLGGDKTDWRCYQPTLGQAECTPEHRVLSHLDKMLNKECGSVLK